MKKWLLKYREYVVLAVAIVFLFFILIFFALKMNDERQEWRANQETVPYSFERLFDHEGCVGWMATHATKPSFAYVDCGQ